MVASELLEAGARHRRRLRHARPHAADRLDRALLPVDEKIAMGDGRFDSARLTEAIKEHAQRAILFDMEAIATPTGAIINAVMLGALAGCGQLPIPVDAFERAIRADGKAVDANLRGFRAGLAAARRAPTRRDAPTAAAQSGTPALDDLDAAIVQPCRRRPAT